MVVGWLEDDGGERVGEGRGWLTEGGGKVSFKMTAICFRDSTEEPSSAGLPTQPRFFRDTAAARTSRRAGFGLVRTWVFLKTLCSLAARDRMSSPSADVKAHTEPGGGDNPSQREDTSANQEPEPRWKRHITGNGTKQ